MVLAFQEAHSSVERRPYIFRSYRHPDFGKLIKQRNPGAKTDYELWKIARATSAAPFYFHSMALEDNDSKSTFLDGGVGANNPSQEAWYSIRQSNNDNPKTVDINVSIGTGRTLASASKETFKRGLKKKLLLVYELANSVTDTFRTHEEMAQRAKENDFHYYRLTVEQGLGLMKLGAWEGKRGAETLDKLRTKTQEYLDSSEAQVRILESAENLVSKRQSRSLHADPDHWERYCYGVKYYCRVNPCSDQLQEKSERQSLRRHIEEMHPGCREIEDMLDQGKVFLDQTLEV